MWSFIPIAKIVFRLHLNNIINVELSHKFIDWIQNELFWWLRYDKKSNTDAPQSMLEPVDKITCIFDIKSDHNAYNKPSLISHKILKKKNPTK